MFTVIVTLLRRAELRGMASSAAGFAGEKSEPDRTYAEWKALALPARPLRTAFESFNHTARPLTSAGVVVALGGKFCHNCSFLSAVGGPSGGCPCGPRTRQAKQLTLPGQS